MRNELFLLAVVSLCSALIDPPIEDVMGHNRQLAANTQELLHSNVFNEPMRAPSLNDPTFFRYARILTLNPAVNSTVTGSEDEYHPELIWLFTENHASSITEIDGQVVGYEANFTISMYNDLQLGWDRSQPNPWDIVVYDPIDEQGNPTGASDWTVGPGIVSPSWSDTEPTITQYTPPKEGGCSKTIITRNYGEAKMKSATADYTLDGIIRKEGDSYAYDTAAESVLLADDGGTFVNPSPVPFKKSGLCAFASYISGFILGDMIDLSCDENTLAKASPRPGGVYNLTVHNLTVVKPRLDVALYATFTIDYEEHGVRYFENKDGGCESEEWDSNGTIALSSSDSKSYEVQNRYSTVIPYSPSFMNFSANTSEDVIYYFTYLSNSELYKYYSRMDGKTGNAYYFDGFNVTSDSYGTQFIEAGQVDHANLLPEDPESANNYTGPIRLLMNRTGFHLRSPNEINNMTYNYSNVYNIKDVYFNLTPGWHHADILLYTWWGDYSVPSDIYARKTTILDVFAASSGTGTVDGVCHLKDRDGQPVAGREVMLTIGNATKTAVTDGSGNCRAPFQFDTSIGTITADFKGDGSYLPSKGDSAFSTGKPLLSPSDNPFVLLLIAIMGLGFVSMMAAQGAMGRFSPLGGIPAMKKEPGKKMVRVKQGKELALSVAAALTGGATAPAAQAAAKEVAKKEAAKQAARQVAKKEIEKKMKQEMMDKGGKKAGKGLDKKAGDRLAKKRMAAGGPPGKPDDKKDRYGALKKSVGRVDQSIRERTDRVFEQSRTDKIGELKRNLDTKNPVEVEILEKSSDKLGNTKMYIVKQEAWNSEIIKIAQESNIVVNNPSTVYGFHDRMTNEIFISEERAKNILTTEKTMRHEVDHVVSKYDPWLLDEGHAEYSAKNSMGDRFNSDLVSYRYPLGSYEILVDLAGEQPVTNHSAYVGGMEELKGKIIERYKDKMAPDDLERRFDSIVNSRSGSSEEAFRDSLKLYVELEPKKFDAMLEKVKKIGDLV
jgi:hypothetical protein